MNIDEATIQRRCTDPVFERGVNYRDGGRIQRLDRFDDFVTATIQGSNSYDVTVEFGEGNLETQCTCAYDGSGDCKHVVAVLLAVAASPPRDESEDIETVLANVSAEELRAFVRDALAENSELCDRFLARFGEDTKSVDEYRGEIGQLFEAHADPVVFEAIDFSRFFEVAERYRDRDRHLGAAAVYRAIFEEVDERYNLVDGAYDHYARIIRRALDGYVECVLTTDPDPEAFDMYAGVLETRAKTEPRINDEQFLSALKDLEDQYNA